MPLWADRVPGLSHTVNAGYSFLLHSALLYKNKKQKSSQSDQKWKPGHSTSVWTLSESVVMVSWELLFLVTLLFRHIPYLPKLGGFWFHLKQFSHWRTGHVGRKLFYNQNERLYNVTKNPRGILNSALKYAKEKEPVLYLLAAASLDSTPARPPPETSHCPYKWRQRETRKCPPWPWGLRYPLLSPHPPRIS